MNEMKKIRLRDKPLKKGGPRVQGMVKNQLEIVEVEKTLTLSSQIPSTLFNDCGMSQADIKNLLYSITIQTRGTE